MRGLVAVALVLAACQDTAPPRTEAPRQMPATILDAAPAADASTGPSLELAMCAPAPLPPAEQAPGTYASLRFGKPRWDGMRDPFSVIRKHEPRLRACYEQALTRAPDAVGGTSKASIIVGESGAPREVILEKNVGDELALCLKHTLMELRFEKPKKAPVTIVQPLTFVWDVPVVQNAPVQPRGWIPYATTRRAPRLELAVGASLALQRGMPMPKLASCLAAGQTGAFRVIARLGTDGVVSAARAGGLGDAAAEACLGKAVVGVATSTPTNEPFDIACDFLRGPPAPWRVSPDAGYTVIDPLAKWDRKDAEADETYLVLLEPTTPVTAITTAIDVASSGAAYVVALRDGAGPPLFVLAARPAAAVAHPAAPLTLDTSEPLRICGGLLDAPASAPFADAASLLANAARQCSRKPCPSALTISLKRNADELATLVAAARRAGFERIRLGQGACPK